MCAPQRCLRLWVMFLPDPEDPRRTLRAQYHFIISIPFLRHPSLLHYPGGSTNTKRPRTQRQVLPYFA